jgi:hypothetical protein
MLFANLTPKIIISDYLIVMKMLFLDLYTNGISFPKWARLACSDVYPIFTAYNH